jgi:Uma2 family endonuclease
MKSMGSSSVIPGAALQPEPAWAIAELFPAQGEWSEEDYLALPGNRLIELSDGRIEVLAMPSMLHQLILAFLYREFHAFIAPRNLGLVLFSALPVRLGTGKYREPDLLFMAAANRHRRHEQYWEGADLVLEVVSPDDPKRDLEVKRVEYAEAGIPEYWLVDPKSRLITVLRLDDTSYVAHGRYGSGERAASALLAGLEVVVDQVFAAGND